MYPDYFVRDVPASFRSLGGGVVFGVLIAVFDGSFLSHVVDLLSSFQL